MSGYVYNDYGKYINEAFSKLRLVEDDFDISKEALDGIEKWKAGEEKPSDSLSSLDVPEEDVETLKVVDPEAWSDKDLKDDYIGDIILECTSCHKLVVMPKEEVYVDDEADACCPDVKCPYCGGELGYNPIGKIEHYEEAEEVDDEEEVELPEEGEEEEVDEVEEEEEVKESLQSRIRKSQLKEAKKEVCPNCGKEPCECDESCDKKELTEGVNNLSLDTDDQHLEVQTDETGRISVVSEPTAGPTEEIPDTMTPGEDSVVPLDMGDMDTIEDNISPEDQDDILNAEEEVGAPVMAEEPSEGEEPLEEPAEGEEEEFEFETESFNYLGNTFAKKLYENVSSYETTAVKEKDDDLVVEGLIKFNSGKMKPTRFIFECVKKTNTNRLVFEGLNETFFPKKAFRLRGKLTEGKLVSESLRYNYTINKLNESTNSPEPVSVRGIVRGK